MPRCILRLGRRRTAWELDDPTEIAKVEFRDPARDALELRPSVYLLDPESGDALEQQIVRARAEHSASLIDPPRPSQSTLEFDVDGAGHATLVASPGQTKFSFTVKAHAELVFASPEDVVAMVQVLVREKAKRAREVPARRILAFIDERLQVGDAEWIRLLGPHKTETGKWGHALRKWRERSSPQQ